MFSWRVISDEIDNFLVFERENTKMWDMLEEIAGVASSAIEEIVDHQFIFLFYF